MSALVAGQWYAIAAEHDLAPAHIYRTALGGHDLAVWRADNGSVQVWHDRCPHRGVRLSLGQVVGDDLRCQYHAWRFGVSGACHFIPAQPGVKVPGSIRATGWPVAQAHGLIWTGIDPAGTPPALPPGAVIRAIAVGRPADVVRAHLAAQPLPALALVIQPLDDGATMLRGVARDGDVAAADEALMAWRDQLERA